MIHSRGLRRLRRPNRNRLIPARWDVLGVRGERLRSGNPLASLLMFLTVACVAVGSVLAQAGESSLKGRLTGKDGASVAGVEITAVNTESGARGKARSNREGEYAITGLAPGTYIVTASRAGFESVQIENVQLTAGAEFTLPIQLGDPQSGGGSIIRHDDIVVTGELIDDTVQETPASVAVWREEFIRDAGMRDLRDVYNQTANVHQLFNGEGFGIRGINHNSVGTGGSGELGSYFIDGVSFTGFSKRFGPMDLWDVEQVEILRGPQTTSVGRNALAGAVILNTRDPVLRNESAFRLGAAEFWSFESAGMVNVKINESSAFRFTAEYRDSEGFVTNPTRSEDDFDARENATFQAKWLIQPAQRDDIRIVLKGQYAQTRRGNDIVDLSNPEDRINTSNLDDFEENDSIMGSVDFRWKFNSRWALRSITSYLRADYRRFDDDDQSPDGGNSFRSRDALDSNWAEDVRIEYADEFLRGVSGFFITQVDLENNTRGETAIRPADVGVPGFLLPFYPETLLIGIDSPARFDTTNSAFFTRWDWDVNDRWSLFGGFRYDIERERTAAINSTFALTDLPDPNAPGLPPQIALGIATINGLLESQLGTTVSATKTDYRAFLPEVGVGHKWNDNLEASVFYKRGYRAGGAELNLTGRQNEFDPEFLDVVEFSLRSLTFSSQLAVNANVYYGSWRDQQVTIQQSDNAFDFLTVNAGESEIYGFELESSYRPYQSWDVYASLGFAHTEFTQFDSATEGDLSGNRFSTAPEWTAALGVNYRFGLGWFVHGDVNYQGSAFATVLNTLMLDARTLLNFRGGYERPEFSVYGYINNVTDETYAVTAFRGADGRMLGKVGPPRQAGIQVDLRF